MPATPKGAPPLESLNFPVVLKECLSAAVLLIDQNGQVIFCQPEAALLLGLKRTPGSSLLSEELPPSVSNAIGEVLRVKKTVQHQARLEAGSQNEEKFISINALPFSFTGEGGCSGVLVILNDLSFSKRLELNMRRLDLLASIGTLSASMAHEIKNALVAVKTFLELLLSQNQDAELAGIVSREMKRIDSIVSQMLKFAGPAKPTFSTVRLHQILEHSIRLIEQKIGEKDVELDLSLEARPDLIKGDDYQLEQAFFNLFLNALEAMPPKGRLKVSTERYQQSAALRESEARETMMKITVADTGSGIPTENMDRLFEPFFTTKNNGTGLGLPITRRIIQEHGGNISVESQLGHGTTFSVYLPVS